MAVANHSVTLLSLPGCHLVDVTSSGQDPSNAMNKVSGNELCIDRGPEYAITCRRVVPRIFMLHFLLKRTLYTTSINNSAHDSARVLYKHSLHVDLNCARKQMEATQKSNPRQTGTRQLRDAQTALELSARQGFPTACATAATAAGTKHRTPDAIKVSLSNSVL